MIRPKKFSIPRFVRKSLVFPDSFGELNVAVVVPTIILMFVATGTIADNHHSVPRFRHLARLNVLVLLDLSVEHDRFLMLVEVTTLYGTIF